MFVIVSETHGFDESFAKASIFLGYVCFNVPWGSGFSCSRVNRSADRIAGRRHGNDSSNYLNLRWIAR